MTDQPTGSKGPSLIAYADGQEIFRSYRAWLHPLLDLREFLGSHPIEGNLTTYDRIVGRASALLSVHLGVTHIRTELVSSRAIPVLEHYGVTVEHQTLEDRLLCMTEDLLGDTFDTDHAVEVIVERARIASERADG